MPSENVHVLIVDDDRSTQRVLADALNKKGFIVTVERDGEWAVKTFAKKPFDVVLLDLLLPGLNGYEVAKEMRALPKGKKTPIIMISGVYKSAIHQKEAVHKHGAAAFLEKPVDLNKLYAELEDLLGDRYPSKPPPAKPPPPPVEDDVDDEGDKTSEFQVDDVQREEAAAVEQASNVSLSSPASTLRGDFATKSFAEVVAELYRWRATGALLCRRAKVKKIVYFRDGNPELVKSNLLAECLGRVLVREKMISEAECDESLTRMKKSKRQQGTVLIEMGCLSPHNLQYALKLQLQEKLYDMFRWEQGEYQFNPKVEQPPEPIGIGMTCAQLIYEGVKRGYDEARINAVFGYADSKFVHHSEQPLYALQEVGMNDDESGLMAVVDGHKKVSTLRAMGMLSPLDTDRLLFAMTCAQMVELRDQAAAGKPKMSIARIAENNKRPEPLPPPLPSMPPPLPPPLPKKPVAVAPPLSMPWENAEVARQAAPPSKPLPPPKAPPPPPPVEEESTPVPKKAKRTKTKDIPKKSESLLPELSEVVSVPKLSADESVKREKLAAKVAAMRRQNYFEILGIKSNASREDVKRSYFALAKEYHPDKHFQSASAETRALAQQIYDLISQAHDTLNDTTERERYAKEIAAQGPKKREVNADVGKMLAAEGKFQRGEELMRQRQFAEAHACFADAIKLYPEEGEFHAWLGWSLFQSDPSNTEQAVLNIEHSIRLNSKLDKSYLFLGYIQKASGRPDKAEKQFEKAIQCNPDCTEALRELRLLGKPRR